MINYEAKKILVVSDSHGEFEKFAPKLKVIGDIDLFIHLGDFSKELDYIEALVECPKVFVRGNCDIWERDVLDEERFLISHGGKSYKVLATHGHNYGVKAGYERIRQQGILEGVDIVMFGHTHMRYISIEDEVTLINPGSVFDSVWLGKKEFLLIEIDENGDIHYS